MTDLQKPSHRRRRQRGTATIAGAAILGLAASAFFFAGDKEAQDVSARRSLSSSVQKAEMTTTGHSKSRESLELDLFDGMNFHDLWMFGRPADMQQKSSSPENLHGNESRRRATTAAADDLPPASHTNVSYGPYPENTFDLWLPPSTENAPPSGRPVIIYIHGGGWRVGNKYTLLSRDAIQPFLDAGIAFASIDYRLTGDLTYALPAPIHDAARAVQYIKHHATEYGLDSSRVALSGFSAGGASVMWLLYHSDLADPNSDDPIERTSTKVQAGTVFCGQSSIDPRTIEPWIGHNVVKHNMILNAVGETDYDEMMKNYDSQHAAIFAEYSPINHVFSAAKSEGSAPPLFMVYEQWQELPCQKQGQCIHHGMFGAKMKERCDEAAVECHLVIQDTPQRSLFYDSPAEFLFDKLGVHKKRLSTAGVLKY